jgi:hypothetical protein
MARGFNLTAEINLRGPSNIRQVVSDLRRQLGSINTNVTVQINQQTNRQINTISRSFQDFNRTLQQTRTLADTTSRSITQLGNAARLLSNNVQNIPQTMNQVAQGANQATQANNRAATATRGATSEFTEFGRQSALAVRRFAAFATVTGIIYKASNAITNATQDFIEFNQQLVKVSQVTDTPVQSLGFLVSNITKLSTGLGVASQDLINVAQTLAQAGLSARDTSIALQALARSALAPSFDDLNSTVEGSIALMRQFGISASQLEGALGSINAVAAKFAVEASDIVTAISRTGGVFAAASKGVSQGTDALNEFIAVFTSVRATTRESAETIATGLRTIFTRIQREDTINALKSYGVALTDLEGKFVGPYEAVRRLAAGLSSLDPRDIRFSRIVEELGGFRQIGKVIPLIQQFTTAQQALNVAQQGQGSLAKDAATAQLSLANQMAKVREEFSALVRSIGQSQGFQDLVRLGLDLASAFISVADAVKGALPALTAIFAIKGFQALTQFSRGFAGGIRTGAQNQRLSSGGYVRHFAKGGSVPGAGNTDSVPAMLTPGEFVMRKSAVQKYGTGNLVRMNNGGESIQKFMAGSSNTAAGVSRRARIRNSRPEDGLYPIVQDNRTDEEKQRAVKDATAIKYDPKEPTVRAHAIDPTRYGMPITPQEYERASGQRVIGTRIRSILNGEDIQVLPNFTIALPQSFNNAMRRKGSGHITLPDFQQALNSPFLLYGTNADKISSRVKRQGISNIPTKVENEIRKAFKEEVVRKADPPKPPGYISRDEQIYRFADIAKSILTREKLWSPRPVEISSRSATGTGGTQSRDFVPNQIADTLMGGQVQRFLIGGKAQKRANSGVAKKEKQTSTKATAAQAQALLEQNAGKIGGKAKKEKKKKISPINEAFSQALLEKISSSSMAARRLSRKAPNAAKQLTTIFNRVGVDPKSIEFLGSGASNLTFRVRQIEEEEATILKVSLPGYGDDMLIDEFNGPGTAEKLGIGQWGLPTGVEGVAGYFDTGTASSKKGSLVFARQQVLNTKFKSGKDEDKAIKEVEERLAKQGKIASDLVRGNVGRDKTGEAKILDGALIDQNILRLVPEFDPKRRFKIGGEVQRFAGGTSFPIVGAGASAGIAKRSQKIEENNRYWQTIYGTGERAPMPTSKGAIKIDNEHYEIGEETPEGIAALEEAERERQERILTAKSAVKPKKGWLSRLRGRFASGGEVQRFMAGDLVESDATGVGLYGEIGQMALRNKKQDQSIEQAIADAMVKTLSDLGGEAGIKSRGISIPGNLQRKIRKDSIISGKLDSLVVAGILNKAKAAAKNEEDRIRGIRKVAIAGLQPIGYAKDKEWTLSTGPDSPLDGQKYVAMIRGFGQEYLSDVQRLREKQRQTSLDFAKDTTATEALGPFGQTDKQIFGPFRPLAIDFDETLAFGTKMVDKTGAEDLPSYSIRDKVADSLAQAKPTRLAQRLAEVEKKNPGIVRGYTRVLTARPQSTADLVATTLNRFGLPYQTSDVTGVSQGLGTNIAKAKADNLAAFERLIDDNEANIKEAKKRGIDTYRYKEPESFDDTKMYTKTGEGNIEGALLEQALAQKLGYRLNIDTLESNRAIDFPDGLGNASSLFHLPPNIETEVKRTLDGSSFEKARTEFERYFTENPNKFNNGGRVKFAAGGSSQPKDTLEKYFTDAAPTNLGLSNSKSLSKNERRGLASDVKNLRQLRTPAPEELYSSLSRNAFDKFAMDTGLNKSPDIPKDTKYNNRQTYYAQEVAKIVGKAFSLPGFVSTSKNYAVAKSFLDNAPRSEDNWAAMLTVRTKKNGQGVDVAEQLKDRKINVTKKDINPRTGQMETFFMKQPSEENEFILSPRSRFRVDKAKYVDLMGRHNLWADVQQFADGGSVPALVSNGEAYVPPKTAKSIGYGNLKRMNQADRNGMGRFSKGGISVFKGPGSGTSDSIRTSLPEGSFILRAKATKALGFNRGGRVGVQKFNNGGDVFEFSSTASRVGEDAAKALEQAVENMMAKVVSQIAKANPAMSFDDAYAEASGRVLPESQVLFGAKQAAETGDQRAAELVYQQQRQQVNALTRQIRATNNSVSVADARAAAEQRVSQAWGGLIQKVKQTAQSQQQLNTSTQQLTTAQNNSAQAQDDGDMAGGGGRTGGLNLSNLGTALAFTGPMLAQQIGDSIGGTTGAGIAGGATAFSTYTSIGAQFGGIGAIAGALVGAVAAVDGFASAVAQKESELATIQLDKAVEQSAQVRERFVKTGRSEDAGTLVTNFQKIQALEEKRMASNLKAEQPGMVSRALSTATFGYLGGDKRSSAEISGARTAEQQAAAQEAQALISSMIAAGKSYDQVTNILQQQGVALSDLYTAIAEANPEYQAEVTTIQKSNMAEQLKERAIQGVKRKYVDQARTLADAEFADSARAKAAQKLTQKINVVSASMTRTFDNLNQAINASSASLKQASDDLQKIVSGATGFTANLDALNVLQNPRAFGREQQNTAIGQASQFAGRDRGFIEQLARFSLDAEDIVAGGAARAQQTGANQAVVATNITNQLTQRIDDVFGRNILGDELRNQLKDRIQESLKRGEEIDIQKLLEESGLSNQLQSSKQAFEALQNSLKLVQEAMNFAANAANEYGKLQQNLRENQANYQNTLTQSNIALKEALGQRVGIGERLQSRRNVAATRAGVAPEQLNATDLASRKDTLQKEVNAIRSALQNTANTFDSTIPKADARFTALTKKLAETESALKATEQGLESLPGAIEGNINDIIGEIGRIQQELSGRQQAAGSFAEQLVGSTPQELGELNSTFNLLNNTLNGQITTINQSQAAQQAYFQALQNGSTQQEAYAAAQQAFAGQTKSALGLFNQLSQMSGLEGPQINNMRADLLENFAKAQGMGLQNNPMFQKMIELLRQPPEQSPEIQALQGMLKAQQAELATSTQALNEGILAKQKDILDSANQTFIKALSEVRVKFDTEQLRGAGFGVGTPGQATNTQRLSGGGIVYASDGTYVNYQPRGTDTIPAMLSPGEFVVNAQATKNNLGLLSAINSSAGNSKTFSRGGVVYAAGGLDPTALLADIDAQTQALFNAGKKGGSAVQTGGNAAKGFIAEKYFQSLSNLLSYIGEKIPKLKGMNIPNLLKLDLFKLATSPATREFLGKTFSVLGPILTLAQRAYVAYEGGGITGALTGSVRGGGDVGAERSMIGGALGVERGGYTDLAAGNLTEFGFALGEGYLAGQVFGPPGALIGASIAGGAQIVGSVGRETTGLYNDRQNLSTSRETTRRMENAGRSNLEDSREAEVARRAGGRETYEGRSVAEILFIEQQAKLQNKIEDLKAKPRTQAGDRLIADLEARKAQAYQDQKRASATRNEEELFVRTGSFFNSSTFDDATLNEEIQKEASYQRRTSEARSQMAAEDKDAAVQKADQQAREQADADALFDKQWSERTKLTERKKAVGLREWATNEDLEKAEAAQNAKMQRQANIDAERGRIDDAIYATDPNRMSLDGFGLDKPLTPEQRLLQQKFGSYRETSESTNRVIPWIKRLPPNAFSPEFQKSVTDREELYRQIQEEKASRYDPNNSFAGDELKWEKEKNARLDTLYGQLNTVNQNINQEYKDKKYDQLDTEGRQKLWDQYKSGQLAQAKAQQREEKKANDKLVKQQADQIRATAKYMNMPIPDKFSNPGVFLTWRKNLQKKLQKDFPFGVRTPEALGTLGIPPDMIDAVYNPFNSQELVSIYSSMLQNAPLSPKASQVVAALRTQQNNLSKNVENDPRLQQIISSASPAERKEITKQFESTFVRSSKQIGVFEKLVSRFDKLNPGQKKMAQANLYTRAAKQGLIDPRANNDFNIARLNALGGGNVAGFLYPTQQTQNEAIRVSNKVATKSRGGIIYASTGMLVPYQPQGTDTVPAMLTPGEFVVNRAATQKHLPLLQSINRSRGGKIEYLADGGVGGASMTTDPTRYVDGVPIEPAPDKRIDEVLMNSKESTKLGYINRDNIQNNTQAVPQNNITSQEKLDYIIAMLKQCCEAQAIASTKILDKLDDLANNINNIGVAINNVIRLNLGGVIPAPPQQPLPAPPQGPQPGAGMGFYRGGIVYAADGTLVNYQPKGTDTVPAMLTPGEFVINRAATQKHLPLLHAINDGYYQNGGIVYAQNGTGPIEKAKPKNGPETQLSAGKTVISTLKQAMTNSEQFMDPDNIQNNRRMTSGPHSESVFPPLQSVGGQDTPINKLLDQKVTIRVRPMDGGFLGENIGRTNGRQSVFVAPWQTFDKDSRVGNGNDVLDPQEHKEWWATAAHEIRHYLQRHTNSSAVTQDPRMSIRSNQYLQPLYNALQKDGSLTQKEIDYFYDSRETDVRFGAMRSTLKPLVDNQTVKPPTSWSEFIDGVKKVPESERVLDIQTGIKYYYDTIESLKNKELLSQGYVDSLYNQFYARAAIVLNKGGMVYAANGMMIPYEPRGTDTVPAMLTPGEFVVNRASTQANLPLLHAINQSKGGDIKGFADGGVVYASTGKKIEETQDAPKNTISFEGQRFLDRYSLEYLKYNLAAGPSDDPERWMKENYPGVKGDRLRYVINDINNRTQAIEQKSRFLLTDNTGKYSTYGKIKEVKHNSSGDKIVVIEKFDPITNEVLTTKEVPYDRLSPQSKAKADAADKYRRATSVSSKIDTSTDSTPKFTGIGKTIKIRDNTGKYSTSGAFIGNVIGFGDKASIKFKKDNGAIISIPLSRLSEEDRDLAMERSRINQSASDERASGKVADRQPRQFSKGGVVYASNGMMIPYEPRGTDTVPAMLTPGEFVVNRAATAKNLPLLRSINSGSYSSGGVVSYLQDGGLPNKPYYGPLTKLDSRKAQRNKKLQEQIEEQEAEAFRKLGITYSDTTSTEDIMEALKKQRDYPKNLDKYINKFNTDSRLDLAPPRFPRISEAVKKLKEQSKQPKPPTVYPFGPIDYGPGPAVQSKANGGVVYAQEGGMPDRDSGIGTKIAAGGIGLAEAILPTFLGTVDALAAGVYTSPTLTPPLVYAAMVGAGAAGSTAGDNLNELIGSPFEGTSLGKAWKEIKEKEPGIAGWSKFGGEMLGSGATAVRKSPKLLNRMAPNVLQSSKEVRRYQGTTEDLVTAAIKRMGGMSDDIGWDNFIPERGGNSFWGLVSGPVGKKLFKSWLSEGAENTTSAAAESDTVMDTIRKYLPSFSREASADDMSTSKGKGGGQAFDDYIKHLQTQSEAEGFAKGGVVYAQDGFDPSRPKLPTPSVQSGSFKEGVHDRGSVINDENYSRTLKQWGIPHIKQVGRSKTYLDQHGREIRQNEYKSLPDLLFNHPDYVVMRRKAAMVASAGKSIVPNAWGMAGASVGSLGGVAAPVTAPIGYGLGYGLGYMAQEMGLHRLDPKGNAIANTLMEENPIASQVASFAVDSVAGGLSNIVSSQIQQATKVTKLGDSVYTTGVPLTEEQMAYLGRNLSGPALSKQLKDHLDSGLAGWGGFDRTVMGESITLDELIYKTRSNLAQSGHLSGAGTDSRFFAPVDTSVTKMTGAAGEFNQSNSSIKMADNLSPEDFIGVYAHEYGHHYINQVDPSGILMRAWIEKNHEAVTSWLTKRSINPSKTDRGRIGYGINDVLDGASYKAETVRLFKQFYGDRWEEHLGHLVGPENINLINDALGHEQMNYAMGKMTNQSHLAGLAFGPNDARQYVDIPEVFRRHTDIMPSIGKRMPNKHSTFKSTHDRYLELADPKALVKAKSNGHEEILTMLFQDLGGGDSEAVKLAQQLVKFLQTKGGEGIKILPPPLPPAPPKLNYRSHGGVVYAQEGFDPYDPSKQRMPTLFDLPPAFSQTQKPYKPDVKPKPGLAGASIGAPEKVSATTQRAIDQKVWENTPQDIPYWFGTRKEHKYEMRSRAIQTSFDESDSRPDWLKNAAMAGQMFENIAQVWAGTGGGGAPTNNGGVYRAGQGFRGNKPQIRPSTLGLRPQLPESRQYIPTKQPSPADLAYREWQESQIVAGQKPLSQDSPKKPSGLLSAILGIGLRTAPPTRSDQKSPQQQAMEAFYSRSRPGIQAPPLSDKPKPTGLLGKLSNVSLPETFENSTAKRKIQEYIDKPEILSQAEMIIMRDMGINPAQLKYLGAGLESLAFSNGKEVIKLTRGNSTGQQSPLHNPIISDIEIPGTMYRIIREGKLNTEGVTIQHVQQMKDRAFYELGMNWSDAAARQMGFHPDTGQLLIFDGSFTPAHPSQTKPGGVEPPKKTPPPPLPLPSFYRNLKPSVNKARGGMIYASTGTLVNYQPRGTDTVPAMLTPGEFVVNRQATQRHLPVLRAINDGYYQNGGIVSYLEEGGEPGEGGSWFKAKQDLAKQRRQKAASQEKERQAKLAAERKSVSDAYKAEKASRERQYRDRTTTQVAQNQQTRQQANVARPQMAMMFQQPVAMQPQAQSVLAHRVNQASQAAFNPQSFGNTNQQLTIFGTVLTGVNQTLVQFGAILQGFQQPAAGPAPPGGNNGNGVINGVAGFVLQFGNLIKELQRINIPQQINLAMQPARITVDITGAQLFAALQPAIQGVIMANIDASMKDWVANNLEGVEPPNFGGGTIDI